MKLNKFSFALVATVLASISSGAFASDNLSSKDEQTAALIASLIENGQATVDPTSGKLVLKGSISSILMLHGLIQIKESPDSGPDKTYGGGSC